MFAGRADESVRGGLGGSIRVRSHGPAQLKTRSQPVEVYSVARA